MRLLQIISARDINGAVVHCKSLIDQLQRRGHEVLVACPEDAWIGRQVAPSQLIPTSLDRWPLSECRRVARIAAERGIEVTHTHQSRAHSFGVMLRLLHGIPTVATAHNRRIQLHWALNNQVIGVSRRTTAYHRRFNLVARKRSTTIHNFVDPSRFAAARAARTAIRARRGLSGRIVVTMVSTVMAKKGLQFAVEALPEVLERAPATMLQVVGGPRPRDAAFFQQLQQRAERLGVAERIRWVGRCDDVSEPLAASDVFLCASLEENLPISILEAMAFRLPVVATKVGGVPECVSHDVTGRLIPPRCWRSIARELIGLSADAALRERLGGAGERRLRERFSPATQVPRIEQVLQLAAGCVAACEFSTT